MLLKIVSTTRSTFPGGEAANLSQLRDKISLRHHPDLLSLRSENETSPALQDLSPNTPGQIWWARYYRDGRPIRESTGTTNEIAARRFLKEREGQVATGQPILPRADRIRYDEVAEDLRRHYQTTGAPDLDEADFRLTEALRRTRGQIIPWVFHRTRKGKPIGSFRRAWKTACTKVGLPGRIPHDFRRTAVRNLERAGVSRSVAMKMVGHKTEAIYRRYAIVDEVMLREGAEKLARAEEGKVLGKVEAGSDGARS